MDLLLGDPAKARRLLGWSHTVTFADLVAEMVTADLAQIAREHQANGLLAVDAAE